MMVQPMVENAIEHGIIKSKNDGFLSLNFSKHDGSLIINISDNGKGLSEDFQFKPDHALQIIKEHVNLIKQKTGIGSLEINQGVEGKGLTVIITLPYLTE
jgi:sensor histidine kinase YesM